MTGRPIANPQARGPDALDWPVARIRSKPTGGIHSVSAHGSVAGAPVTGRFGERALYGPKAHTAVGKGSEGWIFRTLLFATDEVRLG
jgi:hypothetical protein